MTPIRLLAAALAAAPLLALSAPASAASSYDACTGFIASVPTTISTQGIWCFNKDLNTPVATGSAITVTANNVTIDCNGFKLGGLQAGLGTATVGIFANGRSNLTVRDCNIRGFLAGVSLEGDTGGGHRIEHNRFEANTAMGIGAVGDGVLIRDNLVTDTGGTSLPGPWVIGIGGSGVVDVIDNRVVGVFGGTADSEDAVGIFIGVPVAAAIHRNRVSGILVPEGSESTPVGILLYSPGQADVRDNMISNTVPGFSVGCSSPGQVLRGNALQMGEPSGLCEDGGLNYGFESP